jgi:hypothetical protein
MPKKPPFILVYADEVKGHLRTIEGKYHSVIESTIEDQLLHEPDVETRNRKPLKRPIAFGADWELRLGPGNRFRVFEKETKRAIVIYAEPWVQPTSHPFVVLARREGKNSEHAAKSVLLRVVGTKKGP